MCTEGRAGRAWGVLRFGLVSGLRLGTEVIGGAGSPKLTDMSAGLYGKHLAVLTEVLFTDMKSIHLISFLAVILSDNRLLLNLNSFSSVYNLRNNISTFQVASANS